MNDKQFIKTYCQNCGTQRCEGIGSEWFSECKYRWNHDSYDAATEIELLNKKIGELVYKLKQEVEDKETEIQKLLSLIDNLNDDLREYKTQEPQYFYNG